MKRILLNVLAVLAFILLIALSQNHVSIGRKAGAALIRLQLDSSLLRHKGTFHHLSNKRSHTATDTIECLISIRNLSEGSPYLVTGYAYDLLDKFCDSEGCKAEISLKPSGKDALTALRNGETDIICIPGNNDLNIDDMVFSPTVDSLFKWVMREEDAERMKKATKWISEYNVSDRRAEDRARFFQLYVPGKGGPGFAEDRLTPYDSLLKVYAEAEKIDWKLLAAVMYQESKFRIEAVSPTGAKGLMQFVSGTAKAFNITNTLSPEQNIKAGAELLTKLKTYHRSLSEEQAENFILAAYNGGEGRVRKAMEVADSLGLNPNEWENVREAIHFMHRDSIPSPLGDSTMVENPNRRNWMETAAYVGIVKRVYGIYKRSPIQ